MRRTRHCFATIVALVLAVALAVPFAVAQASDPELERWVKAYEEAIDHTFDRGWLTRHAPRYQIIRESVTVLSGRSGEAAPALTGDANRDTVVALEFLRRILAARPQTEWDEIFIAALNGLVKRWDPYARVMHPAEFEFLLGSFGFYDEGIGTFMSESEGRHFVTRIIPGMGGDKAGIRVGDEIIAIGGVLMANFTAETIWHFTRNARRAGFTTLLVRRGEFVLEARVEYQRRIVPWVRHQMIDDSVGLIVISAFFAHVGYEVEDAIEDLVAQGARAIVLDLRWNPGGFSWDAKIALSSFMRGPFFTYRSREGKIIRTEIINAFPSENVFVGPVAVLLNARSASASEIMALALRERPQTRLFGQDIALTHGKGVGQVGKKLANGWFFFFTISEVIDLADRTFHNRGVAVDERILTRGVPGDPAKDRAVHWLRSTIAR